MPTGTGKTITAILGAVLFAIERRGDMQQRVAVPPTVTGVSDVTGDAEWDTSSLPVSNKCMFFTPRHLLQHWLDHAQTAKRIVESMAFEDGCRWKVSVLKNKLAGSVNAGPNEVVVIICDSARCGIKKYLQPSVHYSTLCFDEVAERDGKVNALCQTMVTNIKHGRIILVSADFSKWRHHFDVRSNSMLRYIFPKWDRYNFSCATAAACTAASVFAQSERAQVMLECTDSLKAAVLDVARISYRPSLVERVGGGYAAELGEDRGCDLFHRKYGVNVSSCGTVDEVIAAINAVVDKHEAACSASASYTEVQKLCKKINVLHDVSEKIKRAMMEDCPVCLERKDDLTLIQPCLHFLCRACMARVTANCPMCRGEMRGTVGVTSRKKQKTSSAAGAAAAGRIGSLFFDEMARECGQSEPVGVMQAVERTLKAVQGARSKSARAGRTLRTMLICPGSSMREGLFTNLGFDVMHYRTHGDAHDIVTVKRMGALMDNFQADDGKSKLLCVRDAGHGCKQDSMTGLDIRNLDCVVSIGGLNLAQRMGRLCRLSRMSLPDDEKHGLYVDIVPKYD